MKFSLIIPVYNVEEYLKECIDSVLSQTYTNIEIILVDDGSPDNCPQICDEYAKRDSRIRVIHKANGGLSDARNAGMRIATGDYVMFIDSDDALSSIDALSILYQNLSELNYPDILTTNTELGFSEVISGKEFLQHVIKRWELTRKIDIVVWNKVFKRSLIKDTELQFPTGFVHEDDFWTIAIMSQALTCAERNIEYYYHRTNDSSITQSKSQKSIYNRANSKLHISLRGCKYLEKNLLDKEISSSVYNFYCATYLSGLTLGNNLCDAEYERKYKQAVSETSEIMSYFKMANNIKYRLIFVFRRVFGMDAMIRMISHRR